MVCVSLRLNQSYDWILRRWKRLGLLVTRRMKTFIYEGSRNMNYTVESRHSPWMHSLLRNLFHQPVEIRLKFTNGITLGPDIGHLIIAWNPMDGVIPISFTFADIMPTSLNVSGPFGVFVVYWHLLCRDIVHKNDRRSGLFFVSHIEGYRGR